MPEGFKFCLIINLKPKNNHAAFFTKRGPGGLYLLLNIFFSPGLTSCPCLHFNLRIIYKRKNAVNEKILRTRPEDLIA